MDAEIITITATDGIGDINYSNLKSRHIDLSYDGTKPTVKVSNVIPPEGDNVETRIGYYAQNSSTESDWVNDLTGTECPCPFILMLLFDLSSIVKRKEMKIKQNTARNMKTYSLFSDIILRRKRGEYIGKQYYKYRNSH